MTDRQDINIEKLRKVLLARLAELERLNESSADSRDAVELDQTRVGRLSRMDAMQQQEMAKEAQRRRGMDRQRIKAALKRLDEGGFGYCLKCDEEISAERLKLDPAVPACINCAT